MGEKFRVVLNAQNLTLESQVIAICNMILPAVSHKASFTRFPSIDKVFTLKSTPIVAGWSGSKMSSVKRNSKLHKYFSH